MGIAPCFCIYLKTGETLVSYLLLRWLRNDEQISLLFWTLANIFLRSILWSFSIIQAHFTVSLRYPLQLMQAVSWTNHPRTSLRRRTPATVWNTIHTSNWRSTDSICCSCFFSFLKTRINEGQSFLKKIHFKNRVDIDSRIHSGNIGIDLLSRNRICIAFCTHFSRWDYIMQMISLRCHISVFSLALLLLCRGACGLDLVMKMGLRWRFVYGPPQPDGLGAFCHATSMKIPPSKK